MKLYLGLKSFLTIINNSKLMDNKMDDFSF
jgi:hypothetical protein